MLRRLLFVLALLLSVAAPALSTKTYSKGSSHKGASSTSAKTGHSKRSTSTAPRPIIQI
jgi:hypothetical protein